MTQANYVPFELVEPSVVKEDTSGLVMKHSLLGPKHKKSPMVIKDTTSTVIDSKTLKTKRGSKTKTKKVGSENIITATSDRELSFVETNEPYDGTYDETTNMLKTAVAQIDIISGEVKTDLDQVRKSRTLKRKYEYIPQMAGTLSTLMGTKVSAIREINNSITQSHNLELKRMKEVIKETTGANKSDDAALMDMYNAFVTMPGQPGTMQPNVPSIMEMTTPASNIIRATLGENHMGYENYSNNMDPTLKAMRYESDPNIKTVVVYDKSNGSRYFDVMNVSTGESVPGVQRPDPMFLEDTTIDVNSGIARNTNLDQSYDLIVIGNNPSAGKY